MSAPNYKAGGTIEPCRFVMLDDTAGNYHTVLQCDAATSKPVGISQEGSHDAPGLSGAATAAAEDGDTLQVHGIGDECLLEIAATVVPGDLLVSDADGKGVVPTISGSGTTVNYTGARALQHGASGEKIRVVVLPESYVTV